MKQNLMKKIWEEIKWRPRSRKQVIELFKNVVFGVVYYGFVIGFFGYFIYAFQHGSGSDVAFQMATISGVLGGLVLSGGLIQGKSPFGVHLRRIGILFIASTLGFILVGLSTPLVNTLPQNELPFKFFKFAFQAGFLIGVVGFSFATGYLAVRIPQLWKRDSRTEV